MTLNARRFALELNRLFKSPKRLPQQALVACSAGLDSMVLVDLLHPLYKERPGHALHVAYVDHGQRPRAEIERDKALLRSYCKAHGLTLHIERPAGLAPGASEAQLRAARYERLAARAQAIGKDTVVFTAHHAQDQLETFLLRLVRGAHPATLRGIRSRARRRCGGLELRLARPLLSFDKAALRAYAEASKLAWHEDSTNSDLGFARNQVRHELIPLLDRLRPQSSRRVLRFFSDLEKAAPRRSAARRVAAALRNPEGLASQDVEFAELKAAIDLLLDEKSHRTRRGQWETLKHQLDLRAATKRGGGPQKQVQFPGGHAVCFKGNRLFWRTES